MCWEAMQKGLGSSPSNRSEDIDDLFLVGASTQPGAGTPSVMMSAKMTAREIAPMMADFLGNSEKVAAK